jgi:lipoprotein-releasing system ATP-binding protein
MSNPIVSVRNLDKSFHKAGEEIKVLQHVALDVFSGDSISIVGQSGSGKSTLLQILGALDRPSSGELLMEGKNVFKLANHKIDAIRNQKVGFIFQFHHLLPDHDATGNVAMPLIIKGESVQKARQEAVEVLKKVGLSHRLEHKPGELSGGEQQRVAIARALVHKPQLILADEPTGNLDPKTATEIMELLMKLTAETEGALVIVTHDRKLADRCQRRFNLVMGQLEERR